MRCLAASRSPTSWRRSAALSRRKRSSSPCALRGGRRPVVLGEGERSESPRRASDRRAWPGPAAARARSSPPERARGPRRARRRTRGSCSGSCRRPRPPCSRPGAPGGGAATPSWSTAATSFSLAVVVGRERDGHAGHARPRQPWRRGGRRAARGSERSCERIADRLRTARSSVTEFGRYPGTARSPTTTAGVAMMPSPASSSR